MKVIALTGPANNGKSHCINNAYLLLLDSGYSQVPGHFRILGNPVFEDIIDILTDGKKKVGIISMGDYVTGVGRSLASLLHELDTKGCDAVICACRNNPKIFAAVRLYPIHHFHPKTTSTGLSNHRVVNASDARVLVSMI